MDQKFRKVLALGLTLVLAVAGLILLPQPTGAARLGDAASSPIQQEVAMPDIVDTAIAAENFTTLVAALQAANLVDALRSDGPFTVFAPTDEAFAALPAGTVDTLLQDPEGALTEILLYHVITGQVMAADLTDGLAAETLQGGTVTFTIADDTAKVNEANIIVTDIETTNGVIHVIDAVILPPEAPGPTAAAAASGASTSAHAVDDDDDDDDDDDRRDRKRGRHYGKGHYGKHYYDRHRSQRYWHHSGNRHHGQRGHYSGYRGQRRGWRGHR